MNRKRINFRSSVPSVMAKRTSLRSIFNLNSTRSTSSNTGSSLPPPFHTPSTMNSKNIPKPERSVRTNQSACSDEVAQKSKEALLLVTRHVRVAFQHIDVAQQLVFDTVVVEHVYVTAFAMRLAMAGTAPTTPSSTLDSDAKSKSNMASRLCITTTT